MELKYQLLNPAPNFMEVVEVARSVVLAGGTMSPVSLISAYRFLLLRVVYARRTVWQISDVINQLFYSVPLERITSFSCGHVIPEENLQTMVVAKGPKGTDLDFKAGRWQGDPSVVCLQQSSPPQHLNIGPWLIFICPIDPRPRPDLVQLRLRRASGNDCLLPFVQFLEYGKGYLG